ncbi:hypothetical protein [Dysgonomonas sp.]|uniref:hypothetical protein n=1 Tax=Dysgonomonas sp. TaxID=1891233 RepID=UPI0027B8B6F9|nr:hypothetical protein [Dysgonomonas sp.]
MKAIAYITLIFIFISCNQNRTFIGYKNVDIKNIFLLLDSINNSIEDEVIEYSDSIIKSLEFTHLPMKVAGTLYVPEPEKINCLDTTKFFNLIKTIQNKDIAEYLYYFERRSCSDRLDYTPYALYMAIITDNAEVSLSVYESLYSINHSRRKNVKILDDDMSLDELTKDQRNLAIYYLIKSYKLGEKKKTMLYLSYYFEKGLYSFPKDLPIAYKLKSIFWKENGIEYWPGTDIKIE